MHYKERLIKRAAGNRFYIIKVRKIYKELERLMIEDLLKGKKINFMGICNMQIVNSSRKLFKLPDGRIKIIPNYKRLKVRVNKRLRKILRNLEKQELQEVKNANKEGKI